MEIPKSSLFLVLLLLTILIGNSTAGSSSSNCTDDHPIVIYKYIWRSCKATLYQRVCYASLASQATYIGEDPILLAVVAAKVTQSRLLHVNKYFLAIHKVIMTNTSSLDPRTVSAMVDCLEMVSGAVHLVHQSEKEVEALVDAKGMDVAWHIGNAQTWLSAAITNQETCKDGFTTVGVRPDMSALGRRINIFVLARMNNTESYTSNALALVNSLVSR